MGVLLKLMFGMLGVFALGFAAAQALRNARRLDRRIARFKAEQEELEAQGRTAHPYMALAQTPISQDYADEEDRYESARKRKRRIGKTR